MGLLGAGAGALGYAGYKYGPTMYQQGRELLGLPKTAKAKPPYLDLLTQEEHRTVLEDSLKYACAQSGVKQAEGLSLANLPAEVVLGVSVLGGVPLGIAGHIVSRAIKSDEFAQREQKAKIKYYRDVTRELGEDLEAKPSQL